MRSLGVPIQYTFWASKENKNTWNKWEIRSNFFAAWRRFISPATVLISSHIDIFQWLYQVQPQTVPWSTVSVSYSALITRFQIYIKSIYAMELFQKKYSFNGVIPIGTDFSIHPTRIFYFPQFKQKIWK